MDKLFQVHKLNETGMAKAKDIAEAFDTLLETLTQPGLNGHNDKMYLLCPEGRYLALVKTKLEEACFFAKKAMASDPENGTVVE